MLTTEWSVLDHCWHVLTSTGLIVRTCPTLEAASDVMAVVDGENYEYTQMVMSNIRRCGVELAIKALRERNRKAK